MKLKKCTKEEFDERMEICRNAGALSGPFIHSAPRGNIFSKPFKKMAWTLNSETELMKQRSGEGNWEYYIQYGKIMVVRKRPNGHVFTARKFTKQERIAKDGKAPGITVFFGCPGSTPKAASKQKPASPGTHPPD